jgi:hypothetical protein
LTVKAYSDFKSDQLPGTIPRDSEGECSYPHKNFISVSPFLFLLRLMGRGRDGRFDRPAEEQDKRRTPMKRVSTATVIAVLFVAAVAFAASKAPLTKASTTVWADEEAGCSVARAAGVYGVSDSGTVIGVGPRVALALLTLDAAGNISGPVTSSLNGSVSTGTLSGAYKVNSDCTGSTTFGEYDSSGNLLVSATVALVWDDHMREFRFLFTSATLPNGTSLATAINGDARKVGGDWQ